MLSLDSFIPFAQQLRVRASETVRGAVIDAVPHIVVDDHRWMLPAIWVANQDRDANPPVPLVLLDRHAELAPWDESSSAHARLHEARSLEQVLDDCQVANVPPTNVVVHDGNWLRAAVMLNWVRPGVTIGLESPDHVVHPPEILECGQIDRRLFRPDAHWLAPEHADFHQTIGWQLSNDAISFSPPPRPIYLSVDLDTFAYSDDDGNGMKPWRKDKLSRHLGTAYENGLAQGHSFRETYRCWLQKASFVLISMETEMFIGKTRKPRQRERAEQLLENFWAVLYDRAPSLIELS